MTWTVVLHLLVYGAAWFLLTAGGNLFCRLLLKVGGLSATPAPPAGTDAARPPPPAPSPTAGRLIGSLERTIIMIGLIAGSWEIMAAVIALKTVARFKDLDERIEAEYFLVGSLASIFWAICVTGGFLWYDQRVGLDVSGALLSLSKG